MHKPLDVYRKELAAAQLERRRRSLRWVALRPWEYRRLMYLLATGRKREAEAECLTKRPILLVPKRRRISQS